MKKCVVLLGVVVASVAHAQVLWEDDFESYSNGDLFSQSDWFGSGFGMSVVEGGSSLPPARSGTRMAQANGEVAAAFRIIPWADRLAGNNTLIFTASVFMPNVNDIAFVGHLSNSFHLAFFHTQANGVLPRSGNISGQAQFYDVNQWHDYRIESNFDELTSDFYVDNVLRESLDLPTGIDPAYVTFNIVTGGNGTGGATEYLFDSFKVEAVPEPVSLIGMGAAGLLALRRRRA